MLRALAVMSKERSQAMPNLPTIAEAGYPGLDGDGWVGALVPVGTPKEIIALLRREIVEIIALPGIKQRLSVLGFEAVGSTPEEFTAQLQLELEKWAKVIRAANLKAE
jgi:tripartite-type tricarboxylate transporter receptor subunit TctC